MSALNWRMNESKRLGTTKVHAAMDRHPQQGGARRGRREGWWYRRAVGGLSRLQLMGRAFLDVARGRAHRGGIAPSLWLCQSDGGRTPALVVLARSNPDSKWEFAVQQEGPSRALWSTVRVRCAVRSTTLKNPEAHPSRSQATKAR